MLAILGALKQEIIDLERGMAIENIAANSRYQVFKGTYKGKPILLAQTGPGRERAEEAAGFVLANYPVSTLVSIGFAGALTGESRSGDVVLCSTLCRDKDEPGNSYRSDASILRLLQFPTGKAISVRQGKCLTVSQPILRPGAKRALADSFNADIVDMESYWIARLASERHVAFLAIRAISDAVDDSLPPLDRLINSDGRWQRRRAARYFLLRPRQLEKMLTLYRNSRQARANLTRLIDYLITSEGLE